MNRGPLSTTALLILSSLAEGERHGYAIRKDLTRRTSDEITVGITTLYRLLKQLLDTGLIEETDRRPAPELDDERRRYFRITLAGRRALKDEVRRLERVLAATRGVVASPRTRS